MNDIKYNRFESMYDSLERDPVEILNEYRNLVDKEESILKIWHDIEKDLMN